MRILIVTPLYPPDIAGSAQYVKELATRLSVSHTVTILTYGHIPESIPTVRIVSVEKSQPLLVRLSHFTSAFLKQIPNADVILVENGPSVELPLFLVHTLHKNKNVLFHLYDERALCHTATSTWYHLPFVLARMSASKILTHTTSAYTSDLITKTDSRVTTITRPLIRPEILPFETYPESEMRDYEQSWSTHIDELATLFSNI